MAKSTTSHRTLIQAILILVVVFGGFIGLMFWAQYTDIKLPESTYDTIDEYKEYLKVVSGNPEDVLVYLDSVDDDSIITIYNHTDHFFSGTVEFTNEDGKVVYYITATCIRPQEVRQFVAYPDEVIKDYQWKKTKFYKFRYPEISFTYHESADTNNLAGYGWKNYLMASEDLTVEHCMEIAKWVYTQDVIAGQDSIDLYFYDEENVKYETKDGLQFPLTSSAKYGAVLDQDEKTVSIVTVSSAEVEELAEETMK